MLSTITCPVHFIVYYLSFVFCTIMFLKALRNICLFIIRFKFITVTKSWPFQFDVECVDIET